MIAFRWCARCGKYSAISLAPNCRLHSTAEEVRRADDFDALPLVEQLELMMTAPLDD